MTQPRFTERAKVPGHVREADVECGRVRVLSDLLCALVDDDRDHGEGRRPDERAELIVEPRANRSVAEEREGWTLQPDLTLVQDERVVAHVG